MLKVSDFDGEVLLQYYRKKDTFVPYLVYGEKDEQGRQKISAEVRTQRGDKQGVVVAIGKGVIGWSLCDEFDFFDKAKGIHIALGRAMHAKFFLDLEERSLYYENIPQSLEYLADDLYNRSMLYFKD